MNFVEADIGALVKAGENVFVYSLDYFQHDGVHFALFDPLATESLRNCLYFDTAIEAVYLKAFDDGTEDKAIAKQIIHTLGAQKMPQLMKDIFADA